MWSSSPTVRPFLGLAKVTRAVHRASAREVNDARRLRCALHMINVIQKKKHDQRDNVIRRVVTLSQHHAVQGATVADITTLLSTQLARTFMYPTPLL